MGCFMDLEGKNGTSPDRDESYDIVGPGFLLGSGMPSPVGVVMYLCCGLFLVPTKQSAFSNQHSAWRGELSYGTGSSVFSS
jgi:hypothetical protein